MQRSQTKIVRLLLRATQRFHVAADEFKAVGLFPVDYRVEQLKLGHMFNIINVQAPEYLRTNVEMVNHRYPTRASNLACVSPRVKDSGQSSSFNQVYATGTTCLSN